MQPKDSAREDTLLYPDSTPRAGLAWLLILAAVSAALIAWRIHISRSAFLPGSPDSVNAAVVARNLVDGRGYTVDFIRYHVSPYPRIHHGEDIFEIVYPTLAACAMLLVGDNVTAVRLPNIILASAVLPILTFLLASRRMKARWAAFAALVTAGSALVGEASLQGWNDLLSATAILVAAGLVVSKGFDRRPRLFFIVFAVVAGAGAMCKAATAVVLAPVGVYALVRMMRVSGLRRGATALVAGALASAAVYSPILARNVVVHGSLSSPVQAYVLPRHLAGARPAEEVYRTAAYSEAAGSLSPVGLRQYVRAAAKNAVEFARFANSQLGLVVLVAGLVGFLKGFRWAHVLGLAAAALALWTVFFHHFESRYLVTIVPLLAIAAGFVCWRVETAIVSARRRAGWAVAAFFAAALLFAGVFQLGGWRKNFTDLARATSPERAALWERFIEDVKTHAGPGAVLMTDIVEAVDYSAGIPAVSTPFGDIGAVLDVGRRYGVTHFLAFGGNEGASVLDPLAEGSTFGPFELVFAPDYINAYLYRINRQAEEQPEAAAP